MIKADLLDVDVLEGLNDAVRTAPKRFNLLYGRLAKQIQLNGEARLRKQPGSPNYPLRWKSPKQRRAVMAKLRREGNLPHRRTGRSARAWTIYLTNPNEGAAELIVENRTPHIRFLEGDDQQPFHIDTGWLYAPTVIRDIQDEANDAAINLWGRILDVK
jgi:hypothetical protein